MKKVILLTSVMVFVLNIFANPNAAKAQMKGSGMFSIAVQYEQNADKVKEHIETALFGSLDEALKIYRNDLKHISGRDIMDITNQEIANQLGEPFDANHPEAYKLEFDPAVSGDIFNEYEDSYLIDGQGAQFFWGDPRDFPINKGKTAWAVYTITSLNTGKSVKFRANCGNVFRLKHKTIRTGGGTPYNDPIPNGAVHPGVPLTACPITFYANPNTINEGQSATLIYNYACGTVHIDDDATALPGANGSRLVYPRVTHTYVLTTQDGRTKTATVHVMQFANPNVKVAVVGGGFWHSPWPYIIGGTIVGVAAYAKFHKPHDNSYDSQFQGGSGSSWNQNGDNSTGTSYPSAYGASAVPSMKSPGFVARLIIGFK